MTGSWETRAAAAADEVHSQFGHRLPGLPGTWIGALHPRDSESAEQTPPARLRAKLKAPIAEWHYWWQAHYLDAICDTGFRKLHRGEPAAARHEAMLGEQLLRGIRLRNLGRFPNYFYDDMAWLALSSFRLNRLSAQVRGRPSRLAGTAQKTLTRQLHRAGDQVLGGGLYWSRQRAFKNTPVNAPAALHFARIGEHDRARELVDWLRGRLFDSDLGLYLDGIHLETNGPRLDHRLFTYNQGPIIGALLELGSPEDLEQVADLIEAVAQHMYTGGQGLRLEYGGDGNLFTGILCRYLVLAANDRRLPPPARTLSGTMVRETAERIAGQVPSLLSAAIQRWSLFNAAASLPRV
ncbi:glycosyl hydrolase [Glutamicibacter sp. MNS18]|uniref:glycoside hydrolase family 76 protein n=1 Tax=Glutamicibacter sp. MNS18 TaxID=2989817 RepID=UPI0022358217|nr:glycoside hydrolase family 76 protein [Glutamicibacter sp. MNS18]MCW4465348.1 glycosyl hydrolase [Glutamicibacter sp. MNS18]